MSLISYNNRFIVEPYAGDRTIKTTSGSGFAMIQQKVSLKGLKLLVDVVLIDKPSITQYGSLAPQDIPKGSIIYIKEELLYTQQWAKQILESDAVEGKFIIVDGQYVEMIDIKRG